MKIEFVEIQNFRKLKCCRVDFAEKETIFVGANNSGKTSAMDALILFLKDNGAFTTREFTLSNWKGINETGKEWEQHNEGDIFELTIDSWKDLLPQLDVWLKVSEKELHFVSRIIPTLSWNQELIGVRLRFEPKNIESLYKDYLSYFKAAKETKEEAAKKGGGKQISLKLWPTSLWDFLDKGSNLRTYFTINAYILDPGKLNEPINSEAKPQTILSTNTALDFDPFKNIIKVDIINAQRGFTDPTAPVNNGNLSTQLREYYSRHLNPSEKPDFDDIGALEAIETAKKSFDERLSSSFKKSFDELEGLNYPGFGNPPITISSFINPIDGINHDSAIQFGLLKSDGLSDYPLTLPEKYNGLGYQNLISMVFRLIRFRDEWMQVGKGIKSSNFTEDEFQPLHLVLIEEPEAHLHAQVQQVFINKAYDVLRNNESLGDKKQFTTQLVVSTHSSHIAHEVTFTSLRYFKRQVGSKGSVNTSTVINLSKTFGGEDKSVKFAIRYLKSTHCDLFFADAAILIEGPAERMLIPHFIKLHFPLLSSCYLSILEIGGSHAHTLRPLIEDLGLITLIVTDIDSMKPEASAKWSTAVPVKGAGYKTNNDTLKMWLPVKDEIDDLLNLKGNEKISNIFPVRVAYQTPIKASLDKEPAQEVFPYTFEDSLVLHNIEVFKSLTGTGLIKKMNEAIVNSADAKEAGLAMFNALQNGKKAEFALELLFLEDPKELTTPDYIADGLNWLQAKLKTTQDELIINANPL